MSVGAGIGAATVAVRPSSQDRRRDLLPRDRPSAEPVTVFCSIAARLPAAELGIVRGGRHDVLNDIDHRSVAAHVVQWLERLRSGPDRGPVVVVETLS